MSNTKKIKTKPTKAQSLMGEVANRMMRDNIPCMMIVGDREKKCTGIVMDTRKEMRDLNISVLLDAMLNAEKENSKALINVILGASAILLANLPEVESEFQKKLAEMKASYKDANPINQTAEA